MQEIAARPHLLESRQIAALMMHARQAILHKLLGNECQPIAIPLGDLAEGFPHRQRQLESPGACVHTAGNSARPAAGRE